MDSIQAGSRVGVSVDGWMYGWKKRERDRNPTTHILSITDVSISRDLKVLVANAIMSGTKTERERQTASELWIHSE